jgi:hypothetical protein
VIEYNSFQQELAIEFLKDADDVDISLAIKIQKVLDLNYSSHQASRPSMYLVCHQLLTKLLKGLYLSPIELTNLLTLCDNNDYFIYGLDILHRHRHDPSLFKAIQNRLFRRAILKTNWNSLLNLSKSSSDNIVVDELKKTLLAQLILAVEHQGSLDCIFNI